MSRLEGGNNISPAELKAIIGTGFVLLTGAVLYLIPIVKEFVKDMKDHRQIKKKTRKVRK